MDALAVVVLLAFAGLAVVLNRRAIRPRAVLTTLPPALLRQLFAVNVAGFGWHLARNDPFLAESSLLTGLRQRIRLDLEHHGERTVCRLSVVSYEGEWMGVPQRPYTLSMRMNAFVKAVRAQDPTARVLDA